MQSNLPQLHVHTVGEGQDLVLLHGWGVNSAVFHPLQTALSHYRVHYVDLPGFGDSAENTGDINAWAAQLAQQLPKNAVWLGWSLGGSVATQIAITYPESVKALITVASSPCFMAQEAIVQEFSEQDVFAQTDSDQDRVNQAPENKASWPGIAPKVLAQFSEQLQINLAKTVERFLAIQAMGSDTAKNDIAAIKKLVLAKPLPSQVVLDQGLGMLRTVDLRSQLSTIQQPWLRIWGRCDSLVPKKIIKLLPQATSIEDVVHNKASHAPFISHPQAFLAELLPWIEKHTD
ncbi:alpha/beta fold hydrolase [Shewanella sp. 10N.7]|uniref:alpha/beta fold hydrolase n=1 Tax=Shewanella sp. 10N.7 TaxID=2885093 RepID=UPI001E519D14|nr:alpha/beta fold hydrolase [Shewanella sp. 10N.7]MCC4833818.1 alpha/beta fold hydrolase [Shewanella sp. 10N.7]